MRKKLSHRRKILPDRKYQSVTFHKLINNVMEQGKKYKAENICYYALDNLAKKLDKLPMEIWQKICDNVTPSKKTIPRKVGGCKYAVPVEIKSEKGICLVAKIITKACRSIKSKSSKDFKDILLQVLEDSYNNTGSAVEKKNALHKDADDNEKFAHFRW